MSVLIVGAGPSGLSAAAALRRIGVDVTVVDRDPLAGGVPAYSDHQGYGLRDQRRSMRGPAYARLLADRAVAAGATIRLRTMATDVTVADGRLSLGLTSPQGRETATPDAVVLATGCRERPRSARLVAGSRPDGVITTGWLQRHVMAGGDYRGRRVIIVGAEHVSYSAAMTLAHAGAEVVGMLTPESRTSSYAAFDLVARARWRFPLETGARVLEVKGRQRVTGVEVDIRGRVMSIGCNLVVFTGDWVPEHELASLLGVEMSAATRGPVVDELMRTTRPGVLAVGNLLHPPATADVCALGAARVVDAVARWLGRGEWTRESVPLRVEAPLLWASPGRLSGVPMADVVVLSGQTRKGPRLVAEQADRTLWSGRVPWLRPTRPVRVPGSWAERIDLTGGPVTLRVG